MKVFYGHELLGHFVKLFYSPTRVVDIGKHLNAVGLAVKQRGAQKVSGVADGIFDQAQVNGLGDVPRVVLSDSVLAVFGRCNLDHFIGVRTGP